MQMSINMDAIKAFEDYLTDSEKARATIKKYVYAAEQLSWFLGDQELCKSADFGISGAVAEESQGADGKHSPVRHKRLSRVLWADGM
ncbi:MAG: hypothetical protein ACLRNQ_25250 [Flavonifractor plautii]